MYTHSLVPIHICNDEENEREKIDQVHYSIEDGICKDHFSFLSPLLLFSDDLALVGLTEYAWLCASIPFFVLQKYTRCLSG